MNITLSTDQQLIDEAHVALNKISQYQDVVIRQLFILESFRVIGQSPELIRRAINKNGLLHQLLGCLYILPQKMLSVKGFIPKT